MSVPEIGRSKDAGWAVGVSAADPFPPDDDGEDAITAQVRGQHDDRFPEQLEVSA